MSLFPWHAETAILVAEKDVCHFALINFAAGLLCIVGSVRVLWSVVALHICCYAPASCQILVLCTGGFQKRHSRLVLCMSADLPLRVAELLCSALVSMQKWHSLLVLRISAGTFFLMLFGPC